MLRFIPEDPGDVYLDSIRYGGHTSPAVLNAEGLYQTAAPSASKLVVDHAFLSFAVDRDWRSEAWKNSCLCGCHYPSRLTWPP